MSDSGNTNPAQRRGLIPWKRGQSGNPSGIPKWLTKFRKQMAKDDMPRARQVLLDVMESGRANDRVAAAKVFFEYNVPKPRATHELIVSRGQDAADYDKLTDDELRTLARLMEKAGNKK